MIQIGINGFGRIGKIVFLQLIEANAPVTAINVPDFDINNLETYLRCDSNHHYPMTWTIDIIDKETFTIDGKIIKLLNSRVAKNLNWRKYGVNYVIDATGVFLTQEAAEEHNVDYLIMCAPAKDNTPSFMVGGNHESYNGERIVSNVSCTSNAIIPCLKALNDGFGIEDANFITVHSTTASQACVDTVKFKNRTSRSLFNNIIPHTTGASKSIFAILPELKGKVHGTSVRVPTSNVSMIDLNVKVKADCDLATVLKHAESYDQITVDDNKFKISCDYNTTECACIIDKKACMQMQKNQFKISIWYDNEWSYANKVMLLLNHMIKFNAENSKEYEKKYFLANKEVTGKGVVLRLDWNVPLEGHLIQDYFRMESTIKTINAILEKQPKHLLIVSHLGRPKGKDESLSFAHLMEQINTKLSPQIGGKSIRLLSSGISEETRNTLDSCPPESVFLLDNVRFYTEETKKSDAFESIRDTYLSLGEVFINDAFACSHRDHLSITAPMKHDWGYGYLIQKEVNCLSGITKNINNERVLAVMGGAKMDDKLPLLETLSRRVDGIYIAGGNINSILKDPKYMEFFEKLKYSGKAKIYIMTDGLSSTSLNDPANYQLASDLAEDQCFFDIGMQSIVHLSQLIDEYDAIFWNGTLGVVENGLYKHGSTALVNTLMQKQKKVIIGGGDTACFVNRFPHEFYYVSTGGGASIDFLSNETLVGLPF